MGTEDRRQNLCLSPSFQVYKWATHYVKNHKRYSENGEEGKGRRTNQRRLLKGHEIELNLRGGQTSERWRSHSVIPRRDSKRCMEKVGEHRACLKESQFGWSPLLSKDRAMLRSHRNTVEAGKVSSSASNNSGEFLTQPPAMHCSGFLGHSAWWMDSGNLLHSTLSSHVVLVTCFRRQWGSPYSSFNKELKYLNVLF